MSKLTHDEDSRLFREAMRSVIPLTQCKRPQHPVENKTAVEETPPKRYDFVPQEPSKPVSPDEKLQFSRHLPHKTLRKLRQGQYNAEAELDLHGYTVNDASYALSDFFQESLAANKRVVRIIHGKGQYAILKNQVNAWLREHPAVLAFCSATANQGGTGALTVLLKQHYKEPR